MLQTALAPFPEHHVRILKNSIEGVNNEKLQNGHVPLLPTSVSLGAGGSRAVEPLCSGGTLPASPFPLQPRPLLAGLGSATVSSPPSYSSLPVPLVWFSPASHLFLLSPHFLQFPSRCLSVDSSLLLFLFSCT